MFGSIAQPDPNSSILKAKMYPASGKPVQLSPNATEQCWTQSPTQRPMSKRLMGVIWSHLCLLSNRNHRIIRQAA